MKRNKKSISISELYHENTKLTSNVIKNPSMTDKELAEFMISSKKDYVACKKVKLDNKSRIDISLEDVVKKRRSIRKFVPGYIKFNQLSSILCLSYGPSAKIKLYDFEKFPSYTLLTSPSAGGLYSCHIYVISSKVEKISKGIYYFNADNKELEFLKNGNLWNNFLEALYEQPYAKDASCAIVITANFSKVKHKYGERGYRYALLDAGHIGENVYLTATASNLGVIGVCGFYDDRVNELLSVDGNDESVVYVLLLGNKKM